MRADILENTHLILVRHGETLWNREGRIQGSKDIPLSDLGIRQAQAVATRLSAESFDWIVSSNLKRAVQTAEPLARLSGFDIALDARIQERHFGIFEGETLFDVEQLYPADFARHISRDPDYIPPGGESRAQFYCRVTEALTELARGRPGQTFVAFAHGGVLDAMYRHATNLAIDMPRSYELGNAGINRLIFTEEGWCIETWADMAHLVHLRPVVMV